jgi:hypothetical protein
MKTLTGRINYINIPGSVSITNAKYIRWKSVGNITPHLLPSSKTPLDWHQPHTWIEGELGLTSLSEELASYVMSGSDSTIINPFRVVAETIDALMVIYDFEGFIINNVDRELMLTEKGGVKEPVFVYHFLAFYVLEAVQEY